jgi:heme/copper-type cytochrome/quinol oxidase subunit 2
MDCKGFTERVQLLNTTTEETNATTEEMNTTEVSESSRTVFWIIFAIVLTLMIIVIISVVLFLIYCFKRENSEEHYLSTNTSKSETVSGTQ